MGLGVICDTADTGMYQGEIWVDEMKVVGVKSMSGWASRVSLATQWADVLSISADVNYQGGDFTTMSATKVSLGDSKLSDDFHISTGLDKIMPKSWGVSIPIGGTVTSSLTRPQLVPSTDIYLTNSLDQPDGFLDMASAMINRAAGRTVMNEPITAAEHYETYSYNQSFFASYSKAANSTNPAVDFLLQRLSSNFNYSMTTDLARKGRISTTDDWDYFDLDTTNSYTGGVNYDLSPRTMPAWSRWKPFGSTKVAWLPSRLKDVEFDLLPDKIGFNVATISYSTSMQRQFEATVQSNTFTKDLKLGQGVQIDYTPIKPIVDLSYSLSVNRDFPNDSAIGQSHGVFNYLKEAMLQRTSDAVWSGYYILQNETSRSQQFKASFNPQIFDWLTTTADYSANFSGQLAKNSSDSSQNFMNTTVTSGVNFNSGFTVGAFLQSLAGIKVMSKVAGLLKKGCDFLSFNSINFTYSASSNLVNNNLDANFLSQENIGLTNFMAYQLGLGEEASPISLPAP